MRLIMMETPETDIVLFSIVVANSTTLFVHDLRRTTYYVCKKKIRMPLYPLRGYKDIHSRRGACCFNLKRTRYTQHVRLMCYLTVYKAL